MIELPPSKLDFRCATCGYGVARLRPPERCPMCAGSRWQQQPQRRVTSPRQTRGEARRWLPMPRA